MKLPSLFRHSLQLRNDYVTFSLRTIKQARFSINITAFMQAFITVLQCEVLADFCTGIKSVLEINCS